MSQPRILICRVDKNDENKMTEIASFDVPEREASSLQAETALDEIENDTHQVGQQILRRLLQKHSGKRKISSWLKFIGSITRGIQE